MAMRDLRPTVADARYAAPTGGSPSKSGTRARVSPATRLTDAIEELGGLVRDIFVDEPGFDDDAPPPTRPS
jgi:hypothetical protein